MQSKKEVLLPVSTIVKPGGKDLAGSSRKNGCKQVRFFPSTIVAITRYLLPGAPCSVVSPTRAPSFPKQRCHVCLPVHQTIIGNERSEMRLSRNIHARFRAFLIASPAS
jgi:hypothetical protein